MIDAFNMPVLRTEQNIPK